MEKRHVCYTSNQENIVIGYMTSHDATGRVRVDCRWINEDGVLQEGKTKLEENFESEYLLLPLDSFIEEYSYYFKENPLPTHEALKSLANSLGVFPLFFNQEDVDKIVALSRK